MMSLSRRAFLASSLTAAIPAHRLAAQTPAATPESHLPAISTCGVNYDLGAELYPGVLNRPGDHRQFYRNELTVIRDELHCESVSLFGSDPVLLRAGLNISADLGFDIKLQSRLNFLPENEMLDRLAAVAQDAERVRQNGTSIVLDVGCEYLLFADGLIEGADVFEKLETIMTNGVDWEATITRLVMLLQSMAETAREHFGGAITYSDTPDMDFAWDAFDIVGIDHYLSVDSEPTYIQAIDGLASTGKPVWVNEFGACPWDGAFELGGMAWDIVDYDAYPPQIRDGIVRDEGAQARIIQDSLALIEQSQASRSYLYNFIEPDSTRSDNPLYDYDVTGYSIVSCWPSEDDRAYEDSGFWEPKVAFHDVAEWNSGRSTG